MAKSKRVGPMVLQSVVVSKKKFDKVKDAKKWAKDSGFNIKNVDETGTSFRFRQKSPGLFDPKTFRTKRLSDGVTSVMGKLKRKK